MRVQAFISPPFVLEDQAFIRVKVFGAAAKSLTDFPEQ